MKIAVLGAGNGGQAMAGHFSMLGHQVHLYNRNLQHLEAIIKQGGIQLVGELNAFSSIHLITDHIQKAIEGVDLIMVTTTADAHRDIAFKVAPFLKDHQLIVLNPGRTLGALEFLHILRQNTTAKVLIGEAQSLIYACRIEQPGTVRVIGIKDRVFFSAFPKKDSEPILSKLNEIHDCFINVDNVLVTGLENIGAILHPAVVILNAAAIERGNLFYFYNDMTQSVCNFIEDLDQERLAIGEAFGIELHSVSKWVSYAYGKVTGDSLTEKMQNNPAYYKIQAPQSIRSRMLTEDIPTGILPMIELGKVCGLNTPLLNAVYHISASLIGTDFSKKGRTLENLGISGMTKEQLLKSL